MAFLSVNPPKYKKSVNLVITDLDDTIWDWFGMWYKSFNPYLTRIARDYKISDAALRHEFRLLHTKYHTSECSYIYSEIPSLVGVSKDEFETSEGDKKSILHEYYSNKKRHLKLYPKVFETLIYLKTRGVRIVGFTESQLFYTKYRIKHLGLDGLFDIIYTNEGHQLPESVSKVFRDDHWEPIETKFKTLLKGSKKPNSNILKEIINEQNGSVANCIYIGDKLDRDVYMAYKAGVTAVHANYAAVISPNEYQLLQEVSHWTNDEIDREKHFKTPDLKAAIGLSQPPRSPFKAIYHKYFGTQSSLIQLNRSFAEIRDLFNFFEFSQLNSKTQANYEIPPACDENKALAVDIWKKAIDVQVHFNEIEMKIRNFAVTVFTVILTGLGFLYKEKIIVAIGSFHVPAASLLALLGAFAIFLFYFMDKFWYHRLLLGAVYKAIDIEERWKYVLPELSLSSRIKELSNATILGIKFDSNKKIAWFYRGMGFLLVSIAILFFFTLQTTFIAFEKSSQTLLENKQFRLAEYSTDNNLRKSGIIQLQRSRRTFELTATPNIDSALLEFKRRFGSDNAVVARYLADYVGNDELVDYIKQKNSSDLKLRDEPTGLGLKARIVAYLELDRKSGDASNLTNLLTEILATTLPKSIDAADVAKEAAKKFLTEFSGESGSNLSNLIFDWIQREIGSADADHSSVSPLSSLYAPTYVIHFDHNEFELPVSGSISIAEISKVLRKSGLMVIVVGSADRTGTDLYNRKLSLLRASRVAFALQRFDVPMQYIIVRARTEFDTPTVTMDNVREPENRRVDIWIR
jgi:phosphoglycolate phosphatase-like HAD superfamily hydrolase